MLDLLRRGTVQVGSVTWEYHGDASNPAEFYITPQPGWVMENGLPAIEIVEYQTSDNLNGTGYCVFQVQLSIPDSVVAAVTSDIATRFQVSNPQLLMIPVQSGTIVNLTMPDGSGGTTGMQASGTDFGSDVAIFQAPLTAAQMSTVKQTMGQQGSGPFEIQYSIIVPAQMPAVTAKLSFDSQVAFQYQVTSHEHTHWASSSSYTYDIHEQLKQSSATTVVVDKVDPNLPQSVVDAIAAWGEQVIEDLVAKEVAAALALEQDASGHQSFSIDQTSSFTQSYQQNETILWRLQPVATLPTFGDLGLTTAQIASLETTVDKRQFVAQVTPQCLFASAHLAAFGAPLQPSNDPFMSNIQPLTKLDVTVVYPTLTSSSTKTHTFTSNTPYTWQSDWDDTAGGEYSLDYLATYQNGTQVSGTITQISATNYTMSLADIGTLNVVFDASQFFANPKDTVVDAVTVDFVFVVPEQSPYLQTATLNKANPQHVFSSYFPAPATTQYVYTVTYTFSGGSSNQYTSDAKMQTGAWVRLLGPDAEQAFKILATINDGQQEILEADINIYYDGEPYYPDIAASDALPHPTQSSPIQLSFPTSPSQGLAADTVKVQMQETYLFTNTNVTPLTIVASVVLDDGSQIQMGPYNFTPTSTALLTVNPAKQFAFLGADPAIVQWTNGTDKLTGITVEIEAVRYVPPASGNSTPGAVTVSAGWTQSITIQTQEKKAYPIYFPVLNLPNGFSDIEFDWSATYVYTSGAKYASGTEKGTLLSLPSSASGTTPPSKN